MSHRLWEARYLLIDALGAIDAATPAWWWPFVGPGKRQLLAEASDQLHEAQRTLSDLDLDWLDALCTRASWTARVPRADREELASVLARIESETPGRDQPPPLEVGAPTGLRSRNRRGAMSSAPMMVG